jgi:hypothetical protein
MILIDNTQLVLASIFSQLRGNLDSLDESLVRHTTLNLYRMYRTKFKAKYGEIVICQDGGRVWRRDSFPNYKSNRKKTRDSDTAKWDKVFDALSKIKEEVRVNLPYKNMEIPRCEADDVIATLCKHLHGNEPIVIVSSDKDFAQLQRFPGVEQYSPIKKGFISCPDPDAFLVEHILKGDSSDGVPNILSDDDVFVVDEKRQSTLTQKKIRDLTEIFGKGTLFSANHHLLPNWNRNKKMIDLSEIPAELEAEILKKWEDSPTGARRNLINYFMEHQLNNLMECLDEF